MPLFYDLILEMLAPATTIEVVGAFLSWGKGLSLLTQRQPAQRGQSHR